MLALAQLPLIALGVLMAVVSILLIIWWRQQTFRWPIIVVLCLVAAPLLSWWSGNAFHVADYRAGCDGLCPGFRGAPVWIFAGEAAGGVFLPGKFALNSLVYLVVLLSWGGLVYAFLTRNARARRFSGTGRFVVGLFLLCAPFALAPMFLPPPEAHVRGDSQRIAINAQREVYMYDESSGPPILRVGLEDVRPRLDGSPGMRVCLRTYTFFYLPSGRMYLDMAPEGVHSTGGGLLPGETSCWE